MIDNLLPDGVVAVEAFNDESGESPYPGEGDFIADAVSKRRREFITARRCARNALTQFGYEPAPIRPGPKREPQWPAGIVGSITHCDGYRAAAVALNTTFASIGIDAELHRPLPAGVLDAVTRVDERTMIAELSATDPLTHWDRLLFSAKESVYKAWYPLACRWLGFEDAELTIDHSGGFAVHILIDGPVRELIGRYFIDRGLLLTAIAYPSEHHRSYTNGGIVGA